MALHAKVYAITTWDIHGKDREHIKDTQDGKTLLSVQLVEYRSARAPVRLCDCAAIAKVHHRDRMTPYTPP